MKQRNFPFSILTAIALISLVSLTHVMPDDASAAVQLSRTTDYEQSVVNAVNKVSPAVVSVIISKDVPIIEQYYVDPFSGSFGGDPNFQSFFGPSFKIPQYKQKGVERKEVGGGSGFIISADGIILTNKHVVSDPKASYTVLLNDGRKLDAKVLMQSDTLDIAALKVEAKDLPTVTLGNSTFLKQGQTAIAIGNALAEFRNTVSVGVISGMARTINAGGGGMVEKLEDIIQTDAAINPGNSGGPLINTRGEVIGVNVAVAQGAQNIGFSIPINKVKTTIRDILKTGK